jgi:lipoprotein-releasing system ATP-binding protein
MLSVSEISKSFVQRGQVLDKLTLEAASGDTIAIMGPSGSGKTTLMNIIGLLDKPNGGSVLFKDRDILAYNEKEAAAYRNTCIGFVFQEHLLLPHLTVRENILLPMLAGSHSDADFKSGDEYVSMLMQRTGIAELSGKYPWAISGGEAQRAALVRALVNKPAILLADEPTGSLDSKNADLLGALLTELNAEFGITLILATHSETLAKRMGRIYTISEGRLRPI